MKIAAAYVRVSDERQDEYSPDSQLHLIRDYAKRNDYLLPQELIFRDDGISAKSTKGRLEFNRMIALAESKEHPFDAIIVWKFSRFARNTEDSILLKARLRRHNVAVLSVSERTDESNEFGELIERIIEWDDAHYLTRLSQEVKRGMLEKASRGEPMSRQFGYDLTGKRLIPNADAEIVRRIFRDFVAGIGMQTIARDLNASGFRTSRGNPADNRFVEYVLNNPVYIGKIRWSKDGHAASKRDYSSENVLLFDGKHEPIIDQSLWDAAQARIEDLKRKYPRYQRQQQTVDFMLKGLMRCDSCGATLCMAQSGRVNYIQCHNYNRGKCSVSHALSENVANREVIAALQQAVVNMDFNITPHEVDRSDKTDYDRLIRAEERKLQKAKEAYLSDVDTLDEYQANKAKIQKTLDLLISEREKQQEIKPYDPSEYAEKVESVLRFIQSDASEQAKNEALRSILQKIVYQKDLKTLILFFYV